MTNPVSREAANFAASLRYEDIPTHVQDSAMLHIVDSIGVSIAGATPAEDSGKAAHKLAQLWSGSGNSSFFGLGASGRPETAALLNGSMAQALEMDDKHGSSLARPGSTVIPAVLAVGEASQKSVQEVIAATVAGYEVMIRLGFVAGDRFLARGYHTSSLLGPFGSAIGVGNLTGMDAAGIVDSLGIAGTFASGIQESTRTGSTSKILHGGWGAHAGIIANDLARAGITGPDTVFEGKFGFFETHLTPIEGQLNFAAVNDRLGSKWYLPDTAFKPYPCCQLLHAFIEAAKHILPQMAADGVGVADITAISCQLAEPGLTLVTQPLERKKRPQTPHEARFSLPFGVAAALVDGDVGLETFQKSRLDDQNILRLAALVEASVDPASDYPAHCPAILELTAGGKTYRKHVPHHPGCPEAPLSRDDVLNKFARNASWLYGDAARDVAIAIEGSDRKGSLASVIADIVVGRTKGA